MKFLKYIFLFIAITVALSVFVCPLARTQPSSGAVDRATREVDRSIRDEVERKMRTLPEKEPEIEEAEEKVPEGPKNYIKKIKLVGTESFPPEAFAETVKKYEDREVSMGELNALAKQIERDYLRKGVIGVCFIPKQKVVDDVVTLKVIEARMGDVRVEQASKLMDKNRVLYYWNIKKDKILNYDKMSRDLYEMNKNPDREVRATLHAGKEPGTTDVLLKSTVHFPLHINGSFDNEGAISTGRMRYGAGIRENNFLFVDDTLLAGTSFGDDFRSYYVYHSVPITPFGTSIMYGFSDSLAEPKKEFTPFEIKTRAQTTSFFVHQDIFDKAEYFGEVSVGIDAKDKRTVSTSGTLNRDRLRIIRFRGSFYHQYPGAVTYMSPEFSQGLNFLGARRRGPLSSRHATNTFSKFLFTLYHRRSLPLGMRANLTLKTQLAGEKLTPQEQYFLGGIDSVRGYTSGEYLADNVFQTNFELLFPFFVLPESVKAPKSERPFRDSITPLVFIDYGYGNKRGPTQGERASVTLIGTGAGIRINLFDKGSIKLEWGFPIGDRPRTEVARSRLHISVYFAI